MSPDVICKGLSINLEPPTEQPTEPLETTSELIMYQKMISHFASIGDSKSLLETLYRDSEKLINLDTLAPYWNYIMTLNEPKMCQAFLKFFCKNIEAIKKTDTVIQALNADVMIFMSANDETNLEEIEIFHIVHKWIKLVKPTEEITQATINNIRFPLIDAKKLVQDVQPSGLISDKAYIEAINHNVVPCKDANEKKFQQRKQQSTTDIDFYLCNHNYVNPDYRTITDDDMTPKFISCLKNYISKNGGIPALSTFSTKHFVQVIRASKKWLTLNGNRMFIGNSYFFRADEICVIHINDIVIRNINDMAVGLGDSCGSSTAIGIFVKNDVKF